MPAQRCLRAIFHGKLNRVQFKIKSKAKRKKREKGRETNRKKGSRKPIILYVVRSNTNDKSHFPCFTEKQF